MSSCSSEPTGEGTFLIPPLTFLIGGLAIPTLVALVELDIRVARELTLLAPRELALVAPDTVRTLIGGGAGGGASCSVEAAAVGRVRGAGGVLLLGSTLGLVVGLASVEDVAEIVRVRMVRPGEGPGLRLGRLVVGRLGLRRAEGEGEVALGPGFKGLLAGLGGSAPALRFPRAVAEGRTPRRGLSPGLSFRYREISQDESLQTR